MILVERSGKETTLEGEFEGATWILRARKVWDESFPLVRTSSSIWDPPKYHYVRDHHRLEYNGIFRYVYSHTEPPDRPLAESIAMVGGAAGAMKLREALVGGPEPSVRCYYNT